MEAPEKSPALSQIIFSGWIQKKVRFQGLYNRIHYADRYLVLTATTLQYFHTDKDCSIESFADCNIPLCVIREVKTGGPEADNTDIILCIECEALVTELILHCKTSDELASWMINIETTRDRLIMGGESIDRSDRRKEIGEVVIWKKQMPKKKKFGRDTLNRVNKKMGVSPEILSEDQINLLSGSVCN